MKCPVCDAEIKKIDKCRNCGFEDIRTEFINPEELEMWQKYVVYPCRFAYLTATSQAKKMQKAFQKEIEEIKKTQQENMEMLATSNDKSSVKGKPAFKQKKMQQKEGWNKTGNITYKNYYVCEWCSGLTKCEINNIVVDVLGSMATVHFFVKKIYDSNGANSTSYIAFKWKLKDDYGIVVADGFWANDRLNLGDVTKDVFSISGVDSSIEYVLELVDD